MNAPNPKLIMIGAVALGLAACPAAQAGSTFFFSANQTYSSAADSPYSGSGLHLETFEDGALNLAGVTANHGHVQGPGSKTDSVDGDDGLTSPDLGTGARSQAARLLAGPSRLVAAGRRTPSSSIWQPA